VSHLSQILKALANKPFLEKIEFERANPYPFLGTRLLECHVIDLLMQVDETAPISYSAARGDFRAVEPIAVFSLNHVSGVPVRAPKMQPPPNGELTASLLTPEITAHYALYREVTEKGVAHEKALRARGCATASCYIHRAPETADEGIADQVCLYVPRSRVVALENGKPFLQPNTEDLVKFISYLAQQGFISLEKNAAEIIDAANARVLHLAAPGRKTVSPAP
jgi:hypothetical protein